LEKRNGFNVGDVVVFNTNLPDNQYLIKERGRHNLNTGLVIISTYNSRLDFNIPVFKTDPNTFAWEEYRFELDKQHIIHQILSEI